MPKQPKYKRREDYLEDRELKAKADLAELEHNSGGFLGLSNFLPRSDKSIGVLARLKVLQEADRPVEYDGLLSGRRGSAVMAAILLLLAAGLLVKVVLNNI